MSINSGHVLGVRRVARSIRNASLDGLRSLALGEGQDQQSCDANEWYWVKRFGHPLVDHIQVNGLLSLSTFHAKDLTDEEIGELKPGDLAVLAVSESASARKVAAGHGSTPAEWLNSLAGDSERKVRRAVGHNPATPAEVIARMQGGIRAGEDNDEIDPRRGELLWTELDSIPVDREVAMALAEGDPDFDGRGDALRLALARRKHLSLDIRIALAESYVMSAEVAHILAKDSHQNVRAALASNWETPADVLIELASDDSPAVRIAAGSNHELPVDALERLVKDKDRDVRRAVTINGYISDGTLLALDSDGESRLNLQERLRSSKWAWGRPMYSEHCEPRYSRLLRELSQSPHALTRAAVAGNPGTPVDALEQLAEDEDDVVRKAACEVLGWDSANDYYALGDKRTPIWWYRRELDAAGIAALAKSKSPMVRVAIAARLAQDAHDPTENVERMCLLHDLARDPDANVRASAAQNPWISFEDVLILADDPDEQVQRSALFAIADFLRREQLPRENVEERLKNWLREEESVPSAIPREGLHIGRYRSGDWWRFSAKPCDRLARAKSPDVRAAVASFTGSYRRGSGDSWYRSPNDFELGEDTLILLLQDQASDVRAAALANTSAVAAQVAARADVPVDVLIAYSRSTSRDVRHAVAANAATPPPVLANLARDRDGVIRAAVAANRNTPKTALLILTSDPDEEVLLALLINPNTPPEVLEQQASLPSDYGERERHRRLADNPSSPAEALRKIAYSEWADVRELVAKNPKTPRDALEILSFDENRRVRVAAARP